MGKAMRHALETYDMDSALQIELHHLGLIREKDGVESELYRKELREISRFLVNRAEFEPAVKLLS